MQRIRVIAGRRILAGLGGVVSLASLGLALQVPVAAAIAPPRITWVAPPSGIDFKARFTGIDGKRARNATALPTRECGRGGGAESEGVSERVEGVVVEVLDLDPQRIGIVA